MMKLTNGASSLKKFRCGYLDVGGKNNGGLFAAFSLHHIVAALKHLVESTTATLARIHFT